MVNETIIGFNFKSPAALAPNKSQSILWSQYWLLSMKILDSIFFQYKDISSTPKYIT